MKIAIYLAGSIQKGHELNSHYWGESEMSYLREQLPYEILFLNPAQREDDLSDQLSVFGRDMLQVSCADIVFVDARERRGLGVGAEMMWAKFNHLPVVTLAPKNSHYHKANASLLGVKVTDWVHPFVESLSDVIVDNLEQGVQAIVNIVQDPLFQAKGAAFIQKAIEYYQATNLQKDVPMKQLLEAMQ